MLYTFFASRTGIGVALKAPAIVRRHLFCITESLLVDVDFLASFGFCHTVDPYVIAGRTIAVYACLALANVAPQVEGEIFV